MKIGNYTEILSGYAFKSDLFNSEGNGIPLVRIRDVGKDTSETFYPGEYSPDYIINNGDILIGMDGEFRISEWHGGKALLNQRVCKIVADEKRLNSRYMLYTLPNELKKIEDATPFVTVKHLSVNKIKEIQIPLPPLPVQQKIAAILDAADAYRQKTKALIDKYDQLAQSLFLDMFGDPVKNEKEWEKVATIKYCTCIVPGRDKPKSFTGEIPWVTTSDLIHLGFTEKSVLNIGLSLNEINEVNAKVIPEGSVIMTCVGDLGIISINSRPIVVNQQLHAFQCSQRLNATFLMYNLSHQTPYMKKMASSTTVPYMNKTIANNTPTIVPPINLQNLFAERIQLIEAQKQQAQASLQKAEELFASLLQKAFNGELVK